MDYKLLSLNEAFALAENVEDAVHLGVVIIESEDLFLKETTVQLIFLPLRHFLAAYHLLETLVFAHNLLLFVYFNFVYGRFL